MIQQEKTHNVSRTATVLFPDNQMKIQPNNGNQKHKMLVQKALDDN